MEDNFFKNKSILIIGHTSTMGTWLTILFMNLGAKIIGYGKIEATDKNSANIDFFKQCSIEKKISNVNDDLNNIDNFYSVLNTNKADIVIYLVNPDITAAYYNKALGPYINAISNTLNFLQCIKNYPLKLCTLVVVSDEEAISYPSKDVDNNESNNFEFMDLSIKSLNSSLKIGTSCQLIVNAYKKSFFGIENYKKHLKSITSIKDKNLYLNKSETNLSIETILKSITTYSILIEALFNRPDEYSNSYDTDNLSTLSELINSVNFKKADDAKALNKRLALLNNELILKENSFTSYWDDNYDKIDTYELCSNIIKLFMK